MRLTKLTALLVGWGLATGVAACGSDDQPYVAQGQHGADDAAVDAPTGDGASDAVAGDGGGSATANATIGAPGGRVSSADGLLTIDIPRGALTQPMAIMVSALPTAPPGTLGQAYRVMPAGLRFSKPAKVIFRPAAAAPGDGGAGASAAPASVAMFAGNHWVPLLTAKPDGLTDALTGGTSTLGTFALVPGFCAACTTTCSPQTCFFGADNSVPGQCATYGNGCSRCIPTCDGDGDGFCPGHPGQELPGGDCDDSNPLVSPALAEVCGNHVDDDCDGQIDEGCTPCQKDEDCTAGLQACIDGFCDVCETGCTAKTCTFGDAMTPVPGRCQAFAKGCSRCVPACDSDGDGFCPGEPGNHQPGGDCDDNNPRANPKAQEICGNGIDDNCDGQIDELCVGCTKSADCAASQICRDGTCAACDSKCNAQTCRFGMNDPGGGVAGKCLPAGNGCLVCVPVCDGDGDGFCPGGPGNGQPGGDCNDGDPNMHPGAPEICGNGVDDDCDGHVDEGCTPCLKDSECPQGVEACIDGVCDVCPRDCEAERCRFGAVDGMPGSGVAGRCAAFGNGCSRCVPACDKDGDGYCPGKPGSDQPGGDCNDDDPFIHPKALETCGNTVDENCDGRTDEGCATCGQASMCGASESCSTAR